MEFEVTKKICFDVNCLADEILRGESFDGALEAGFVDCDYHDLLSYSQKKALKIAVFEEVVKKLKGKQED